jgi:pantoate--beta-alanine ligase
MGALHDGHLALVKRAIEENDHVVCSIFVNPTQFNNPEDFEKYPDTVKEDLEKLKKVNCSVAFVPTKKEIYPEGTANTVTVDLTPMDTVMEGAHRPGHFTGVCQVVDRLFEIVVPTRAYFGEKDYQQLMVIKRLVEETQREVKIVPCPTVRQENGLAMSSRNLRLSENERDLAVFIYDQLKRAKELVRKNPIEDVKAEIIRSFAAHEKIELQYFEIANERNIQQTAELNEDEPIRGFVAAYLAEVRLIDNLRLFP